MLRWQILLLRVSTPTQLEKYKLSFNLNKEVFHQGEQVDLRLLLCLVIQKLRKVGGMKVELMVEQWRADRLLQEMHNDKGKPAILKMMIQKLFYDG